MKAEEQKCLCYKKLKDGKTYNQIHKELETLKKSQSLFNNLKKEIKIARRLIIKREEEIELLKIANNKLKNLAFRKGLK